MLKIRILSALLGIPLLLVLAYLGGNFWLALVLVLAAVSLYEFYDMARQGRHRPMLGLGYGLLLLFMLVFTATLDVGYGGVLPCFLGLLITAILLLWYYPERQVVDAAVTWFGALYTGVFFSYAILLENQASTPFYALLLVFLLTWASDTGGYFAGRWLGCRQLAPVLSPKKTWAGAGGAILLTVAVAVVLGWGRYPVLHTVLLGVTASLMAQAGDLTVSAIKRHFGVKDAGHIIPGHGGVLDRFDSFMWVLPLVFYFVVGL